MKASKAKTAQRVEEFVQIILDGAEPHDLRLYVSERQADQASPWALSEGEKPLCDRQIRRYALAAEKVIAESCRTSRKRLMRRHLARRRNLYAKAVNAGDIRTALSVLDSEAKLLSLHEPFAAPEPPTDPSATVEPADVIQVLTEQLRQIERTELPIVEKARITATIADGLLRAIGVGVLSDRLAALQAVLQARKEESK